MRSSWLYLAMRSVRLAEPVLICPQFVATAMSAIVVSSVSPLRWLMIAVNLFRFASSIASSVSVSVPIWFTFTRMLLPHPLGDAALQPLGVGDEQVVADELHLAAELRRSASSSRPSRPRPGRPRCERIGYLPHSFAHRSIISSDEMTLFGSLLKKQ